MATFSTVHLDLEEAYRREHYEGFESLLGPLVEQNDFLRVAAVLPSNNGATHKTLVAKSLGKGAFRGPYQGIQSMASKTSVVSEPIVSYEGTSDVDQLLIEGAPDPYAARMSEDSMNLQGFSNGFNSELLYCTPAANTQNFSGLANRRNKLGEYVHDCGGTSSGALSSMYLVEFGEIALALRYMAGSMPGLHSQDMGLQKCYTADKASYYYAWSMYYKINFGLSVRQDAALQRFANIDPATSSATDLLKKVIKAKNKLPSKGNRAFLFANSDVRTLLDIEVLEKAGNTLSIRDIEGYGPVTHILNIPVLQMDAITSTEAKIS